MIRLLVFSMQIFFVFNFLLLLSVFDAISLRDYHCCLLHLKSNLRINIPEVCLEDQVAGLFGALE